MSIKKTEIFLPPVEQLKIIIYYIFPRSSSPVNRFDASMILSLNIAIHINISLTIESQ